MRQVFTILDEKAKTIFNDVVFLAYNDAHAMRMLRETMPETALPRKYAPDFALLKLGNIDAETGLLDAFKTPVLVCKFDELWAPVVLSRPEDCDFKPQEA